MLRHVFTLPVYVGWLIALVITCAGPALANPPAPSRVILTESVGEYPLGRHLRVLEDPSRTLTINDVRGAAHVDRFTASEKDVPGFGFSQSAYWVRVDIHRRDPRESMWILKFGYAPMQWVDVYLEVPGEPLIHYAGGGSVPLSQRPMRYHQHVFELDIPVMSGDDMPTTRLWVRVDGASSKLIPLTLYRADTFSLLSAREVAALTLYSGIIAGLFLYNLFVYRAIREKSYFYYLFFIATFLIFTLSVNGPVVYLLPERMPTLTLGIIPASMGLVAIFMAMFALHFLEIDKTLPHLKFLPVGIALWGVIAFVLPWVASYQISIITSSAMSVVGSITLLSVGIFAARSGSSAAKLYLLAWFMLLVGIVLYASRAFGLLPTNFLTEYGILWGSAAEAILLSVALATRVRTMKENVEKAQATQLEVQRQLVESQAKTVDLQRESLQNKQMALDIISKYSTKLEEEVKIRTRELIDTQQKLIATEKMAALGVFTAGMAHEVNNPANFIALGAQNAERQLSNFRTFIEGLMDDEPEQEIKREFDAHFRKLFDSVEIIHSGVRRIEHVVKHLRANHPEGHTGLQPTSIVDLLESSLRMLSPTLSVPVTLSTHFQSRALVNSNAAEIEQVFMALLSNAGHAIEDRQKSSPTAHEGHIALHSHEHGDMLVIQISDNGIGIPADILSKIFDPFFTTKSIGRGAGLGLSMAYDVVRKHGGALEVTSTLQQGSTFTASFPITSH